MGVRVEAGFCCAETGCCFATVPPNREGELDVTEDWRRTAAQNHKQRFGHDAKFVVCECQRVGNQYVRVLRSSGGGDGSAAAAPSTQYGLFSAFAGPRLPMPVAAEAVSNRRGPPSQRSYADELGLQLDLLAGHRSVLREFVGERARRGASATAPAQMGDLRRACADAAIAVTSQSLHECPFVVMFAIATGGGSGGGYGVDEVNRKRGHGLFVEEETTHTAYVASLADLLLFVSALTQHDRARAIFGDDVVQSAKEAFALYAALMGNAADGAKRAMAVRRVFRRLFATTTTLVRHFLRTIAVIRVGTQRTMASPGTVRTVLAALRHFVRLLGASDVIEATLVDAGGEDRTSLADDMRSLLPASLPGPAPRLMQTFSDLAQRASYACRNESAIMQYLIQASAVLRRFEELQGDVRFGYNADGQGLVVCGRRVDFAFLPAFAHWLLDDYERLLWRAIAPAFSSTTSPTTIWPQVRWMPAADASMPPQVEATAELRSAQERLRLHYEEVVTTGVAPGDNETIRARLKRLTDEVFDPIERREGCCLQFLGGGSARATEIASARLSSDGTMKGSLSVEVDVEPLDLTFSGSATPQPRTTLCYSLYHNKSQRFTGTGTYIQQRAAPCACSLIACYLYVVCVCV